MCGNMKKVAIIGGGGTGCTMAADVTLRGFEAALYDRRDHWENLQGIQENGGIEMTGQGSTGFAKVALLTDRMEEAVQGAELILIAAVAGRHEEICKELAPLLREGQTVCFSAGNFGSLILKELLGMDSPVVVGEMLGNVMSCRVVGKGKVFSARPYATKKVAAFPAVDNERLVAALNPVYPCEPIRNVFEAALNCPNLTIHLAGSILNTGAIDRNPHFAFYRDGLSPNVIHILEAMEREKTQIMERMGYLNLPHVPYMKQLADYGNYPELDGFRSLEGPSSMTHRYISEDASTGQSVLLSLAELMGFEMPCMRAFVTIASAMNGVDYLAAGKNLKTMGLEGLTPEEINQYLETGKK